MSHVAHELHEEFPEQAEAIHALKAKNAHFARIAEDYHTLNRAIHRMETNVEPADDATIEDLKNSGSSSRMRSPASLKRPEPTSRKCEKRPGLRRGVCASSGIAPAAADCSRGCCRAWSSG